MSASHAKRLDSLVQAGVLAMIVADGRVRFESGWSDFSEYVADLRPSPGDPRPNTDDLLGAGRDWLEPGETVDDAVDGMRQ